MKTLILTLLSSAVLFAGDLYTDTYMANAGMVAPRVSTGIANPLSGETLLKKRKHFFTSLYFHNGALTEASASNLQQFVRRVKQYSHSGYYISIIGHSASFKDDVNDVGLDKWSAFWQDLGDFEQSKAQATSRVNRNIQNVHQYLSQTSGIPATRLYTENRLNKDPLATEATKKGRALNERVDITLLY